MKSSKGGMQSVGLHSNKYNCKFCGQGFSVKIEYTNITMCKHILRKSILFCDSIGNVRKRASKLGYDPAEYFK